MPEAPLEGSVCASCGLVSIPPEPIGCERCGAHGSALPTSRFEGSGTVTAFAVVHHHARPEPPTPFVVVEVALDAGPVVRSQLRNAAPGARPIGQRVDGTIDAGGRFAFEAAS